MKYRVTTIPVDLVLFFWQRIPGLVIHNLAKARTLKTIFWHLNVDGLHGDYLEFGVAQGNSMRAAEIAEKTSILYGGSCNPGNAQALFACENVDGGLIGGASLKATDFSVLVAEETWTILN